MTPTLQKAKVDISAAFFGVPGQPRRITLSATCQDASSLPAKPGAELPPPTGGRVAHCATPLHPGKSPAGQVGCMSHLVMQACVCTWVETHTATLRQRHSAFVITDKKKGERQKAERSVGGGVLFVIVMKRNKNDSELHSASAGNSTVTQTSLHHIKLQLKG